MLPDYRALAKPILEKTEEIKVEEKELADALEYLKKSGEKDSAGGGAGGGLPELNDDFAKSLGKFENLEALKNALRENIRFEKELKLRDQKRTAIIDAIARETKVELPELLIKTEKEKMLAELKASLADMGLAWNHYLDHIKKTEEDLRKEWGPEAEKRVRWGLALREIASAEKIEVSDNELKKETEYLRSRYLPEEQAKLDQKRLEDYAYGIIRNEKVFQILEGKN